VYYAIHSGYMMVLIWETVDDDDDDDDDLDLVLAALRESAPPVV
jgi:hypothetical protein